MSDVKDSDLFDPEPDSKTISKLRRRKSRHKKWESEAPRNAKSTSAGSAIYALLDRLGIAEKVKAQEAVLRWGEFVGPSIASAAQAKNIRDGVLHVKVSDPAWRQELTYLKEDIISKINHSTGSTIVSDIVFS